MCKRQAARENIELPHKFWNQPRWKREFKNQLLASSSLLKTYDIKDILIVLESKPTVYSLFAKWLNPYFRQAQLEREAKEETKSLSLPKPVSLPSENLAGGETRKTFKKKTALDKLQELE